MKAPSSMSAFFVCRVTEGLPANLPPPFGLVLRVSLTLQISDIHQSIQPFRLLILEAPTAVMSLCSVLCWRRLVYIGVGILQLNIVSPLKGPVCEI